MPLSTYEGTDLVHSGTVISVERIEETQTMYNLTVDTAHTFFVGEGEWLVHNTNCPTFAQNRPNFDLLGGDVTSVGQHWQTAARRNRFPEIHNANGVLYRTDSSGNITAYAVYDDQGRLVKRLDLDLSSKPHNGINPPHVLEMDIHVNPDGVEFVRPGITRSAYTWEIP